MRERESVSIPTEEENHVGEIGIGLGQLQAGQPEAEELDGEGGHDYSHRLVAATSNVAT